MGVVRPAKPATIIGTAGIAADSKENAGEKTTYGTEESYSLASL